MGICFNNDLTDNRLLLILSEMPMSKKKSNKNGSIVKFRWTGAAYVDPAELARTKGFKDALDKASQIERRQKAAS